MYSKFIQSIYFKPSVLLMLIAVLSLSFTTAGDKVVLPAGAQILLENVGVIESSFVTVGQVIDFKVVYDIKVDQKVVVKAGTIAKGQVQRVEKNGAFGKPGKIEVAIKSVTAVDGQTIYLTGGNLSEEGADKQTLSIALGIFVCILCFFIKGKNATIPPGTQLNATVATETSIATN